MRKMILVTLNYTLVVMVYGGLLNKAIAQNDILLSPPCVIVFDKHSISIEGEELRLNDVIEYLDQVVDSLGDTYQIVVESSYCPEEALQDEFIGVKRAKVILNYFLANSQLPVEKFIIRDRDARYDPIFSTWGSECLYKSIFIYVASPR